MVDRAVITVQVGQCGNQLGSEYLSTVLSESSGDSEFFRESSRCFFRESSVAGPAGAEKTTKKRLVARAVLVDTEPKVVADAAKAASESRIPWEYSVDSRHCSQGGAGNNWANGYSCCRNVAGEESPWWRGIQNSLRRECERADTVSGVMVVAAVAGGTGSGVGSRLIETMRDSFGGRSPPLFGLLVWPHSSGEVVLQNYNASLTLSHMVGSADGLIIVENDVIHESCTRILGLKSVSMRDMNKVISRQVVHTILPCSRGVAIPSGGISPSQPLAPIRDMLSHLCCHSSFKLLTLTSIPQASASSATFSTDSWPTLIKGLRPNGGAGSKVPRSPGWAVTLDGEGMVVDSVPGAFRSVANFLVSTPHHILLDRN